MDFYSLPYFFLILIFLLIYLYEKSSSGLKTNVKVRFLCGFIFVLFFGFRGYIGSDWLNYNAYYSEATLSSWSSRDYEIGFSFLAKLFHDLNFDFEYFVLVITLFQVFLWDRFLKYNSSNIALSYIILISIFPLLVIDLLRNFTSILIALQAIIYLKNNKKFKAAVFILSSVFFHATGLVFFVLFFLRKKYFKKQMLFAIFLIGIIIYFLQIRYIDYVILVVGDLLGGRFQYLAGTVIDSELVYGIRVGILVKIFFMVIVLFNYNHIVKNKIISPLIFNAFFCYCFIQLYFSAYDAFINRFALLFFWAYLIVLTNMKIMIKNHNFGKFALVIIFFLCFLKTTVTFNQEIYIYSNNLFGKDSFENRKILRNEHYDSR
jgi:hypothetical protein